MSDAFGTPQTVAQQAPLSMGFSRQEYWSGLPFPPPGDKMWENGILGHSWWACKMVWTLQKNSMEGPQKVKELPHDPIISLLIDRKSVV